jgi:hypothetical protein
MNDKLLDILTGVLSLVGTLLIFFTLLYVSLTELALIWIIVIGSMVVYIEVKLIQENRRME